MRLPHLADLHLGFSLCHRQTASGLNPREADMASTLRTGIDVVIAERRDAVLLAGDRARPRNPSTLFACHQLARLRTSLGRRVTGERPVAQGVRPVRSIEDPFRT